MKKIVTITFILILILCTKSFASDSCLQSYHSTMSVDYGCIYAVRNDGVLCKFDIYEDEITKTEIMEQITEVSRNYALKENGTLWTWDSENCTPIQIMESVKDISSCGGPLNEILIQKEDDSLWLIKENFGGQLFKGIMNETISEYGYLGNRYYSAPIKIMDNVKKAAKGAYHSIVLKNDGSVWAWGDNVYGECGVGEDFFSVDNPNKITTGISNVFASGAASFAVKENTHKLYAWGSNYIDYLTANPTGNDMPTEYADDVKDIINIPGYNLLIKKDSSLWLYGDADENKEIIILTKHIKVPVKLYDDIDSVSGIDNCADGRYSNFIAMLNTNGQLYLLDYNDDNTINTLFKKKKIAYNIRLSGEQVKTVEFSDIISLDENKQFKVIQLAKSGIIQGVTDTEFMPDKTINRAETAALMLRMTGKENESGDVTFADVQKDCWYYNIAGASQKYNIFAGYEDNTFRGEETVSELQLAALAARTLRNEGTAPDIELKSTPDLSGIPDWAKPDIEYAYQYGIVTEDELKTLSDKGMTRGDAAVILYRLYQVI